MSAVSVLNTPVGFDLYCHTESVNWTQLVTSQHGKPGVPTAEAFSLTLQPLLKYIGRHEKIPWDDN